MSNNKKEPLSEIGFILASRDAQFFHKQMVDLLEEQYRATEQRLRSPKGLSKEEFAAVKDHQLAIASAKLVLKSVQLFHSAA